MTRAITADDLASLAARERVEARQPLIIVDLDAGVPDVGVAPMPYAVLVGITRRPTTPQMAAFASSLDLTLAPRTSEPWAVAVADVDSAQTVLTAGVTSSPAAAAALTGLLRVTATCDVTTGLTVESLAFSLLLAGPEFARWLSRRPRRPVPHAHEPAVLLERSGARLTITLNRPERRNAFGHEMRDGLIEAFDLASVDASITEIQMRGRGSNFCSGGDLDEFGTTPDVVTAHAIRTERSVAARIHAARERVHVHLHGACIGAGIELSSCAGRVAAHPDTVFRLPEVEMGLVPGAGGTVGITRRVGRWRCAYMALSGATIDAPTALAWGLIDEIEGAT